MGNSFRHLRQLHSNLRFRCELFDELLDVISVGRSMGSCFLKVSFSKGWKSWASCWFNVQSYIISLPRGYLPVSVEKNLAHFCWMRLFTTHGGRAVYIYNTSNFPPVLFLWYWNKREDILSFLPVLIAFIVLIVFMQEWTIPLLLINCWRNKAVRCGNDRSWLEIKSISRWLTWSSTKEVEIS